VDNLKVDKRAAKQHSEISARNTKYITLRHYSRETIIIDIKRLNENEVR